MCFTPTVSGSPLKLNLLISYIDSLLPMWDTSVPTSSNCATTVLKCIYDYICPNFIRIRIVDQNKQKMQIADGSDKHVYAGVP